MNSFRLRSIFVGSSTEALGFVDQLLSALSKGPSQQAIKLVPWNAGGVFELSTITLDVLLTKLKEFDGAVFILMEKDRAWPKNNGDRYPSENLYFEIGLAMGLLGRENVVIIHSNKISVPSDLSGLTTIRIAEDPDATEAQRVVAEVRQHFTRVPPALRPGQGILIEFAESVPDFYERFQGYLRYSRDFVFLVGSGFHCTDTASRQRAENYLRVLSGCALRHKLIRVETAQENKMDEWIKMVAQYLAPLRNVEIYVPPPQTHFLYQDICLIDPKSETSVVELMFGTNSAEFGHYYERPAFGVFLQATQAAEVLNEKLTDYLVHLRCVNAEQLLMAYGLPPLSRNGSDKIVRYFTYGSNMCHEQITDRMPSARFVDTGRLAGYRLEFGMGGTVFRDSVATIIPDKNSSVWGGIAEVSELDLRRLDFYEGVGQGEYEREQVRIESSTGIMEDIPTYCIRRKIVPGQPSPEYLERILRGANELGLPDSYLEFLQSLRHSDQSDSP